MNMDRTHCRQCGFKIHRGIVGRPIDQMAQERGFCSAACAEVYDAIMEDLKHEAEKGL
jgi:hypothetical protein